MKLQTKINYRFLQLLLILFMVAGISLYVILSSLINHSLDETLENRMIRIEQSLTKDPSMALIMNSPDQDISIRPTTKQNIPVAFGDTVLMDKNEHEAIEYRKLTFGATSGHAFYEVSIVLSKMETEDLKELILMFMALLFGIIVLVLFFLNRWLTASIWSPFYRTIEKLKTYTIGKKNGMRFDSSNVFEFNQLNKSLSEMVEKAESDFSNLKEFTENASHEIQTPIAVIKSKLESVLQDNTLPDQRYQQVQSAYEAASRLSKINEGLLLLAKIENRQFPDNIQMNLSQLVKERLEFLEELIDFRKIEINIQLEHPFIVSMNAYLAEILINNLLGNAIKHNMEGGQINLISHPDKLIISNTGKPLTLEPEKLFQRFSKHHAGNDSTGLGLAIASQICLISDLKLQYQYNDGLHQLSICQKS